MARGVHRADECTEGVGEIRVACHYQGVIGNETHEVLRMLDCCPLLFWQIVNVQW